MLHLYVYSHNAVSFVYNQHGKASEGVRSYKYKNTAYRMKSKKRYPILEALQWLLLTCLHHLQSLLPRLESHAIPSPVALHS